MCAKSLDAKSAFRNIIGEVVLMPALVRAADMSACGIIGEIFEMIIHLVVFTSLQMLII